MYFYTAQKFSSKLHPKNYFETCQRTSEVNTLTGMQQQNNWCECLGMYVSRSRMTSEKQKRAYSSYELIKETHK